MLGSGGAKVVMLTSPYYDSGEQGNGQPWPENDPARVATDNSLLMKAVAANPTVASAINLGAMVSPSGRYAADVDGVPLRCSDGVHFTVPGGQWVGERLVPQLVALGRSHVSAAAQQRRPALAPQSQPSWYSSLPCGT